MIGRDFLKLLLCLVTVGPLIILCLHWSGTLHLMTSAEQEFAGAGAECLAVVAAAMWMAVTDAHEERRPW